MYIKSMLYIARLVKITDCFCSTFIIRIKLELNSKLTCYIFILFQIIDTNHIDYLVDNTNSNESIF